jgi:hypothetical protein
VVYEIGCKCKAEVCNKHGFNDFLSATSPCFKIEIVYNLNRVKPAAVNGPSQLCHVEKYKS